MLFENLHVKVKHKRHGTKKEEMENSEIKYNKKFAKERCTLRICWNSLGEGEKKIIIYHEGSEITVSNAREMFRNID